MMSNNNIKTGFSITVNSGKNTFQGHRNKVIVGDSYICENNMIPKYENDKLFIEIENYVLILDGVILNKSEISSRHSSNLTWAEIVLSLYKKNGDTFFNEFRGSFSGAVLNKETNKWIIYTDHIGSKFIFYTVENNVLFCSSMMTNVYKYLKNENIPYSLSTQSAYLILTYGFLLSDLAMCDNVKKIEPGCYIVYEKGKISKHQYYTISNVQNENLSEQEAIEIIDKKFREAIKLQFEKDKEYGYQHMVSLSAGLDCRMTSFVAHDMGYTNQLNLTFSQSNYLDETIPKKMAEDIKHEWIFKALDNGLWLFDVDAITRFTGGNISYYTLAHSNSVFKYLNFNNIGMIHSGQLGDVVIGSHKTTANFNSKYEIGDGAYSKKFISKIENIELPDYKNGEIGFFYTRLFTGTNASTQLVNCFIETISPFQYIDFMEAAFTIPIRFRENHKIYIKWILQKYPRAANYIWETTGSKISNKLGSIKYKGKSYPTVVFLKKSILKLVGPKLNKKGMNPISYYIENNRELCSFIDNYIQENIHRVKDNELKEDIIKIQNCKTDYMEKIQALTILSALKLYF